MEGFHQLAGHINLNQKMKFIKGAKKRGKEQDRGKSKTNVKAKTKREKKKNKSEIKT